MRYVTAQPTTLYFAWQVEVMLTSFLRHGVPAHQIQVLGGHGPGGPGDLWLRLRDGFPDVGFFFYPDLRRRRGYPSSIRPHLLAQHLRQYPYDGAWLYHDCDVILLDQLELNHLLDDDVWYLADCRYYVGAEYVRSKGLGLYRQMCEIVGIDPTVPVVNEQVSGGAQYLIKGTDPAFWDKAELDCELLYAYLSEHRATWPDTPEYHGIQHWAADMWALLWGAWLAGYETALAPELGHVWPGRDVRAIDDVRFPEVILHNAGVMSDDRGYFHKQSYRDRLPYDDDPAINPGLATSLYWDAVRMTGRATCLSTT